MVKMNIMVIIKKWNYNDAENGSNVGGDDSDGNI